MSYRALVYPVESGGMARVPFQFSDIERDCEVTVGVYYLDGHPVGARVVVPDSLRNYYPYNTSAYGYLQQLRPAIEAYGLVEFPGLALNKTNYTVAQRAPAEHAYSDNTYLTDICQLPHQDTPPWPTGFWLGAARRFFATWVLGSPGLARFQALSAERPELDCNALHRILVPLSLEQGWGLLVNQAPGLILLDNSVAQSLYHARTCIFSAVSGSVGALTDTPMYAYSEVGLLHYIDHLDSRRGVAARDPHDLAQVRAFLGEERR